MTERNLNLEMKRYAEYLVEQGWTWELAELEAYDIYIGADERVNDRYDIMPRNPHE